MCEHLSLKEEDIQKVYFPQGCFGFQCTHFNLFYTNNTVSFLGDTENPYVCRFWKWAYCSVVGGVVQYAQTMKAAFKLRVYLWLVNFSCRTSFTSVLAFLKLVWYISLMPRVIVLILALSLFKSEEIKEKSENNFVLSWGRILWKHPYCECEIEKCARFYRDSIKHLKNSCLKTVSVLWKIPYLNKILSLHDLMCSNFWEKRGLFVFCRIWMQKSNIVLKLIANYFCTHTWKTCWYCEYNIIKIHYEITMTIKVSCETPVQE